MSLPRREFLGLAFQDIKTGQKTWIETPDWDIEHIAASPDGRYIVFRRSLMHGADGPALIDGFGRKITYLRLSVTDRCDLRCRYCMAESMQFLPKSEILTLEELAELADIFIARGDFTANAARSRNPEYNTRALSAVIAHEITHVLITDRIGLVDSIRLPSWVAEGYCDHVARESSFRLEG